MTNFPLVSVICMNYNHSEFVIECLNSIKNQTYPSIEIIIVDDFSSDDSVKIITHWLETNQAVAFIKNDKNIGNTKTFNKALNLAKGDYIIDLAADDVLNIKCVELQIEKFQNSDYKNLGIVYGNAELIDERGNHSSYYFPVDENLKLIKKRTSGDEYLRILAGGGASMCAVSSMIKKEVYDKLNGYDESLFYEDLDFWIRASRIYEFDFIDAPIVQKRIVENSHGTKFYKKKHEINLSTFIILKKALALNKTSDEHRALMKRVHFEILLNLKNSHYSLVLKYIYLEILVRFKIVTT
jgi:glycosyltransferase involved in cell wall biosynthesis